MMHGVILYGPPAAGKDSITTALHELDERHVLFPRLKAGPGRTTGYRLTTPSAIDQLRQRGEIVWENERYGSTYVIDRPTLVEYTRTQVPVVHLGQVPAIDAVVQAVPDVRWLVAYLWCPRDVAQQRIAARGTGDDADRLKAWDATERLDAPDIEIDTSAVSVAEAARLILARG